MLRSKAHLTQKELADNLGISDKAVSKWERGLSYPDISLLPKMANLLDTNIESIVCGQYFHYKNSWVGILYTAESEERWVGLTSLIYDKPMVYYLISYFFLLGINQILIIGQARDIGKIQPLLCMEPCFKDIQCLEKSDAHFIDSIKQFTLNKNVALFEGNELIYGLDFTRSCQKAMSREDASVLAILGEKKTIYNNLHPEIYFDYLHKVTKRPETKCLEPYRIVPFMFCQNTIWNEMMQQEFLFSEKVMFDKVYNYLVSKNSIFAEPLGRGMLRISLKKKDDVLAATQLIKIIQDQTGQVVGDPREIAFRRGFMPSKNKGE